VSPDPAGTSKKETLPEAGSVSGVTGPFTSRSASRVRVLPPAKATAYRLAGYEPPQATSGDNTDPPITAAICALTLTSACHGL